MNSLDVTSFHTALYGTIFTAHTEAAFANYRMWESVGFMVAFAYSSFLCTSVKLYILASLLVVGISGYTFTEISIRRTNIGHISGKDVVKLGSYENVSPSSFSEGPATDL